MQILHPNVCKVCYLDENLVQREISLEQQEAVLLRQTAELAVLDDEIFHCAGPFAIQMLVSAERQYILVIDCAEVKFRLMKLQKISQRMH